MVQSLESRHMRRQTKQEQDTPTDPPPKVVGTYCAFRLSCRNMRRSDSIVGAP